jgi:hypothetical protein
VRKQLFSGALLLMGLPLLASAACAPLTPDTYLTNQKVAFRFNVGGGATSAAIGTLTGLPGGVISGSMTRNDNRNVLRHAPISGRWMVNSDCTGGMLMVFFGQVRYTVNIAISATGAITTALPTPIQGTLRTAPPAVDPNGQLYIAPPVDGLQAVDEGGRPVAATFVRNPPMACASANPLASLAGNYNFSISNLGGATDQGLFNAAPPAFGYTGVLTIPSRLIFIPGPPPAPSLRPLDTNIYLYQTYDTAYGRYTVDPDCSTGEILFMGPHARQFEYIPVAATAGVADTLWVVSDVAGPAYNGTVRR